jgi:hypothetical protein
MPEAIPLIAEILMGTSAAVSIGTSLYSLTNQPGAPKPATPAAPSPADALKTRQTQETALASQFPNIQAQTGGSLSPDAWMRLAELLSGQAGAPGIGASSQDLLSKLTGKDSSIAVTAGNAATNPATGTGLTSTAFG